MSKSLIATTFVVFLVAGEFLKAIRWIRRISCISMDCHVTPRANPT